MAALLPLLAMGIPALLSGISGVMGIASEAKKLRGGRIRRVRKRPHHTGVKHRRHKVRHVRLHKGKGVAADVIGSIPLLGSIIGPIVRAMGGKVRRRKYKRAGRRLHRKKVRIMPRGLGLAPMYYSRPYVGMGLRKYHKKHKKHHKKGRGMLWPVGQSRYKQQANTALTPSMVRLLTVPKAITLTDFGNSAYKSIGKGLAPMYYSRPYVGMGLLSPAGGAAYRRGHLRKVPGKKQRVRVKPSLVHRGGYKPYTFKHYPRMIKM